MVQLKWDGFANHVRYEIGDGSKVLFWHNVWCREQPLKVLFPELFTIAGGKDAWVLIAVKLVGFAFCLSPPAEWRRICSFTMEKSLEYYIY
jgi:hypothetical protein